MVRGVSEHSIQWGRLIAIAQKTIGSAQEINCLDEDSRQRLCTNDAWSLTAAARILHNASLCLAGENTDVADRLAIASMVSFALASNFPSARASIKSLLDTGRPWSECEAALIGTCVPSEIEKALKALSPQSCSHRLLKTIEEYLKTANEGEVEGIRQALIETILATPEPFFSAMLRSCRGVIEHLVVTATMRVLRPYEGRLPAGMPQLLVANGIKILMPNQYDAITGGSLLNREENALLAYPTSTGKTLLGELCVAAGIGQHPGLSVYIAPYVAIGGQVVRTLRRHLPRTCRVHPMFGAYSPQQCQYGQGSQDIVVATPERFDGFLRASPHALASLKTVVVDEGHLVQNSVRGARLESVITRLRLYQEDHGTPRIIVLSAVIEDTAAMQDWLSIPDGLLLQSKWRPTVGRISRWRQDGILEWRSSTDESASPPARDHRVLGQQTVPLPNTDLYPTGDFGPMRAQYPKADENAAFLASHLRNLLGGPVLVVSATKAATRRIARKLQDRCEEIVPTPPTIAKAVAAIQASHGQHRGLIPLLRKGVAYHNSTVPHEIRELIEEAVVNGDIAFVSSTTTLAEGVDLPFRTTVLADWLMWTAAGQRPMPPVLFRNIVGRSGRAGVFPEGDTVMIDGPLGPKKYTDTTIRGHCQDTMMDSPATMTSALASDMIPPEESTALIAGQFLAAIAESPDEEDLPQRFGGSLLAARLRPPDSWIAILRNIRDDVLDAKDGFPPFATAASPLRLTELGKAVNLSGFSPDTARKMLRFLRDNDLPTQLPALASSLLIELACSTEQANTNLRKTVQNPSSRFCIKPENFESVIENWLEGTPLEDIFLSLPYVDRSGRTPKATTWINGDEDSPSWEDEYDKFFEFMMNVIGGYLPWALRACSLLVAHADADLQDAFNWADAADLLEERRERIDGEDLESSIGEDGQPEE